MAFETLKCSQCGAVPKEERTKFCGFCGALLPLQVPVPASPIEAPERFEAVLAHPKLPALLDRTPKDSGAPSILPGTFVLVISGVLAALIIAGISRLGLPPGFLIAPALLGALGLFLLSSALRDASAPLHRNVAVVLDERMRVSGGGKHAHARTHYYLLIADRSGTRIELEAEEELAGRTAPGDIGVAYIRRTRLVDFTVVRT